MGKNRMLVRRRISEVLKTSLKKNKVTRKKISEDLGFVYTTFCDWARGRSSPSAEELNRIAEYLEFDVSEIFDKEYVPKMSDSTKILLLKKELLECKKTIKINNEVYVSFNEIERILKHE